MTSASARQGAKTNESVLRVRTEDRPISPLMRDIHAAWVKSGMHITELAAQIGVSQSTLYAWFMGRGRPNIDVLEKLLAAIGYHLEVVRGTRRPEPRPTTSADK